MKITSGFRLVNGVSMPCFGLGVWRSEGQQAQSAVEFALRHGYRLVDTASFYQNERQVGAGLRDSGVPSEQVFLVSKVWLDDMGYQKTLAAYDASLRRLGVDQLGLYLLHWPAKGLWRESWEALQKLYQQGRVQAIGVSNFPVRLLQQLKQSGEMLPMVNQVQFHPLYTRSDILHYCGKNEIQVQAWAPLARGVASEQPVLLRLAEKYNKTPEQIMLRWDIQLGVATIPKTVRPERIIQNAEIFDFELQPQELQEILALNQNLSISPPPDGVEL